MVCLSRRRYWEGNCGLCFVLSGMKKRKREIWRTRRERGGVGGVGVVVDMVGGGTWFGCSLGILFHVVGFMWVTGVVVNALELFESLSFFR